jgi:outer membrane immunogenic protein
MNVFVSRLSIAILACMTTASQCAAIDLSPATDSALGKVNWTGTMINPYFGYETLSLNGAGAGALRDPKGWRVGSAFGYDYQLPGTPFVVGGAADIFYSWYEGGEKNGSGLQGRMYDFGDVRARLGYAFDRFLVYGTGGYAFGDFGVKNASTGASDRQFLNGWTAGAGVEWVYNRSFTIRGEIDHTSYGATNFLTLPSQSKLGADLDSFKIEAVTRF